MSQSPSQHPEITSRVGAILRATGGNFLEMFDFFLFGFYATYIAKAFFPAGDEVTGQLRVFTFFWLGSLMRPVGTPGSCAHGIARVSSIRKRSLGARTQGEAASSRGCPPASLAGQLSRSTPIPRPGAGAKLPPASRRMK